MNELWEKIGRRKIAIATLLASIIVFSVVYALVRTRPSLAILTDPPPGIPGPYYVAAEAKIYGPVVNLAKIESKMGGTHPSDYSYVQWGTNPFYRVYVDNTLQEVYFGEMIDVMVEFSHGFGIAYLDLENTFNNLKNVGAIDPSSISGSVRHFGNMPGVFVLVYSWGSSLTGNITTRNSRWYAATGYAYGSYSSLEVSLNDTTCLLYMGANSRRLNASGSSASLYEWYIVGTATHSVTLYFEDLLYIDTTIGGQNLRVCNVTDSPGTGYVSKDVSPSSPVAGTTINVTVRLDPPAAEKMNITDLYPNSFTWTGGQVVLKKYRVGVVGEVATEYVTVTPSPSGSNMEFTIYYDQASSVLETLLADEYVHMSYTLNAPSTAGEYTLPAAIMTYLIPTPQP